MSRPGIDRLVLAAAIAFAAQPPLSADLVVLRNGQELRGRVRTAGNKVHIDLDIGGRVTVDRGDIARREVEEPVAAGQGASAVPSALMTRLETREKTHLLVAALSDPKASRRDEAQRGLIQAGRAALPILRQALDGAARLKKDTATQRAHLLAVLAAIGDVASLPAVRKILLNPDDKALHAAAAKALAEIAGPDAAPTLTAVMANATDDAVALESFSALVAMRSQFAVPFLLDALRRPIFRQPTRTARAVRAAYERWRDPIFLPYTLELLDASATEARKRAAAARATELITPGHVAALSKLLDLYEDQKPVYKALREGVYRVSRDFPVVGDVELLTATQAPIRKLAHSHLKRTLKADRPDQPNAWQAERQKATRARLLLVPVGALPRGTLKAIAETLRDSVQLDRSGEFPAELAAKPARLAAAEGGPRDVRRLLAHLHREQVDRPQTVRVIGVTAAAIAAPGFEQALAPWRPGGAIVVSLAQLGTPRARTTRAARLLLHALARSAGIDRCADPMCPSAPIYEAAELASRRDAYCPACARAVRQWWAAEADAAAFRFDEAAKKLARAAGKSKTRHANAAYAYERALNLSASVAEWQAYLKLETDKAVGALVQRRIDRLERAARRLKKRGIGS